MKHDALNIGDRYVLTKTITDDMVRRFADFSGDYNPVHMDDAYCREHGLQARIAHGMLVLSFLSTLIGMYLPGEGTVWMSQNIDFIAPVRIGDTIDIAADVTQLGAENALGFNVITLKIRIKNQNAQLVAKGSVKVTTK
jgi:3-hydroxybutyryl-CoA dehydratase